MRASRIAAGALVASALLGLGLQLAGATSEALSVAVLVAFAVLDAAAVCALAIAYRDLPALTRGGLAVWAVGVVTTAYVTAWVVPVVLGGMPDSVPSDLWYHVDAIAHGLGPILVALGFTLATRVRSIGIAALATAIGAGVAIAAHYAERSETVRTVREVAYSSSLLLVAWVIVTSMRQLTAPPMVRSRPWRLAS